MIINAYLSFCQINIGNLITRRCFETFVRIYSESFLILGFVLLHIFLYGLGLGLGVWVHGILPR